jgi:toxin secretion/phage lysis holin
MQDNLIAKAAISSVFAAVTVRLGALGDLFWLFVAAVALDYITGMTCAVYNRELNSGVGFRGLLKKIGEFLVVAAAFLCDEVVSQSAAQLGAEINLGGTVASIVTVWLIVNEIISILENIARMNVALPPFLLKAVGLLKKHSEMKND